MSAIKAPRGVRDILPEESWKWSYVLDQARRIVHNFGYREIHLPIFENTDLFARGIGESTDVVEKEMYTFLDRGERSLTLRPEATASMVRAHNQNNLGAKVQPTKLWCSGPMFRYERPQKGRYRQFWQLDFESLGSDSPLADVEIIKLSLDLFGALGLSKLDVLINSVGCPDCRPDYREKLQDYFRPHLKDLCNTCNDRFDRNPLRILDCKKEGCRSIAAGAPEIYSSLCEGCRVHFDDVVKGLTRLGVKYHLDKYLVRGLDYYTRTAFEILSGELGSQNAVCGGGRYDNLSDAIGGPHLPGVGFAAGLERIVLVMEQQGCSFGEKPETDIFAVAAQDEVRLDVMSLVSELRSHDLPTDMDYMNRNVKSQFKTAIARGASVVCILGEDELSREVVTVKDLQSGKQEEVPRDEIVSYFNSILAK